MIVLPFDPTLFTKSELLIGGIKVNVYNLDKLVEYVKTFDNEDGKGKEIPIQVLYLIHGRKGSAKNTESFGYNIVERYDKNKTKDIPMIFVTFDCRNHGSRIVDREKNLDWKDGNDSHGIDFLSIVEGSVYDLKNIMDYLPITLNLDSQLVNNSDYKINYINIVSGYSLGGHIVYRMAIEYPQYVDYLNPVIGCNNLTSLLVDRLLKIPPESDSKRYLTNYQALNLKDYQQYYNKLFHERLSRIDLNIMEHFPFDKKAFVSLGKDDPLVPNIYSLEFLEKYQKLNPSTVVYRQEGKGHEVTIEMIDNFADWLVQNL